MENKGNEGISKHGINERFVILDVFSRDSLYIQCMEQSKSMYFKNGLIDFKKLQNRFEQIAKEKDVHELCKLKKFAYYREQILPFLCIHPDYGVILKENHNESSEWSKTLLFFATSQPIPKQKKERDSLKEIIKYLTCNGASAICPFSCKRDDHNENTVGPTPLHLMVVKEATSKKTKAYKHDILNCMLRKNTEHLEKLSKTNLDVTLAIGPLLQGKTILNIAARTLDTNTIELLLTNGIPFDSYNTHKDNVYHSLVRFAMVFPDKEKDVIDTMKKIEKILKVKRKLVTIDKNKTGRPESLWRVKNHEHLTPLQLAAKHGRFELFKDIVHRKVSTFDKERYLPNSS